MTTDQPTLAEFAEAPDVVRIVEVEANGIPGLVVFFPPDPTGRVYWKEPQAEDRHHDATAYRMAAALNAIAGVTG